MLPPTDAAFAMTAANPTPARPERAIDPSLPVTGNGGRLPHGAGAPSAEATA
jgi:hypothetical protein